MSAIISLEQVSKSFRVPLDRSTTLKYRLTHVRSTSRYRHFRALQDITFDVPEGQFLGITGHNGSGKSTLLKILSRIYTADSGTVQVNGRVSPFLELGVGFNPELSARDNVFLNGAVIGLTRGDLRRRVDEIIGFAELEDFADQKLKNFSSGMHVRLAFSVAIQAEAAVLLMDEVLAVGDARFQEKCFDVFARYKREGRTIVLVTHDLGAIEKYCDRALLLDHGKLVSEGQPARVCAQYRRMIGVAADADWLTAPAVIEESERWGNREMEVTAVRLLRGDGHPHHSFTTGEPMVIEIDYKVNHGDGDFLCGIGVRRNDGFVVASTNTGEALRRPAVGRSATIRYCVDALPLLDNAYYLAVNLVDAHTNHTFDHIERVANFRVADERGRQGLVDLGGSWDGSVTAATPQRDMEVTSPRHDAT